MRKDMLDTVEEIARNLDANAMLFPKDRATKKDIRYFETKYNVTLPARYKEWLMYSDGGEILPPVGVQLYGIAHFPIVGVNRDGIPEGYIMIGRLGNNNSVIAKKDSEEIAIYDHTAKCIWRDAVYRDFRAFLKDMPHIFAQMIGPGQEWEAKEG